jgi:hypothetical protein
MGTVDMTTKPIVFDGAEHREMTDAEFAQYEADKITNAAQADALAAKVLAREALLDRLGITADEAQLLLGGL